MGIVNLISQSIFPYKFPKSYQPSINGDPVDFDAIRASIHSRDLHGIEGPYERLQKEDKQKEDMNLMKE